MSDLVTDHVTEQTGWNHVEDERGFTVPSARGKVQIAAVTTSPATAASAPVTIGSASC